MTIDKIIEEDTKLIIRRVSNRLKKDGHSAEIVQATQSKFIKEAITEALRDAYAPFEDLLTLTSTQPKAKVAKKKTTTKKKANKKTA